MNPFGQAFLGQVVLAGSSLGQLIAPNAEEMSLNDLYSARYRAAVLKDWEAVRYYDYLIQQKWDEMGAPTTATSPPYLKYPIEPGFAPPSAPPPLSPPVRRGPWGVPLPPVQECPQGTVPVRGKGGLFHCEGRPDITEQPLPPAPRPFSPRNIPRGTQSPFFEEQSRVPSEDWRFAGCRPGTQRMVPGGACVSQGLVSTALTMPTAQAVPTQTTVPMSPGAFSSLSGAFLGQVPIRRSGPF